MVIKASLIRPLTVGFQSISGQGDKYRVVVRGLLADPLRHLKAIEFRQSDVE